MSSFTESELGSAIRQANDLITPVSMAEVVGRSTAGNYSGDPQVGGIQVLDRSEVITLDPRRPRRWVLGLCAAAAVVAALVLLGESRDSRVESIDPTQQSTTTTVRVESIPAPDVQAESVEQQQAVLVAEDFAKALSQMSFDGLQELIHPDSTEIEVAYAGQPNLEDQLTAHSFSMTRIEVMGCIWSGSEGKVECALTVDDRLSRIDRKSFDIMLWITVEDGLIRRAVMDRATVSGWMSDIWVPFITWAESHRPDDVPTLWPGGYAEVPLDTPEGRALYDELIAEYSIVHFRGKLSDSQP